jgi:hypothetical protein
MKENKKEKKYSIHKLVEDRRRNAEEVKSDITIKRLKTFSKRKTWCVQLQECWTDEADNITIQVFHPHFDRYGDVSRWSPSYEIRCENFTGLRQALEDLGY